MKIKDCRGYELEKEQPNTSEDFFNRSEVVYLDQNEERIFHVLYVRYFDEQLSEEMPYNNNSLFKVGDRQVTLKDVIGIVCLLSNPNFRNRKRVYINSLEELLSYFKGFDFDLLPKIFQTIEENKLFNIEPTMLYTTIK
ncbi:hypothetical protein [Litchfieldia salsa]|uniref:Uncharacterized protein n=1 Tax=Litchfieldia salsa TaxID=930152 RepID=A0A1H0WGB1_9BACI|nr:hypothetical protein [Litchfieldia salsa]SDP89754.1 hypothetical protein SAMN05216565_11166 [Litchfieldia salsa]